MKNHDGQIMKEFGGLRVKTSSYLKVNNDKDKKAKSTKKSVIKRFKFKDYKICLEAAQIENKINHLEKNKIDVYSLKDDQKEVIMFLLKILVRLLQVLIMIKECNQLIR